MSSSKVSGHDRRRRLVGRISLVAGASAFAFMAGASLGSRAGVASPETPRVKFSYLREAGAAECPDAASIQSGVAARLGYDPFNEGGPARISALLRRSGSGLQARIERRNAAGEVTAERTLVSDRSDCAELAAAVELAVSIAIDPLATAPAHAAEPVPAPLDPPAAPSSPPAAPPASEPKIVYVVAPAPPPSDRGSPSTSVPFTFFAAVGAMGAWGTAPSATWAGTFQAAARRGALSLAVEGRADWPASLALRVGQVRSSLLTGSLVPCVHRGGFSGCLLVTMGARRAAGVDLDDARQVTSFYGALAGRIAYEVPVGGPVALRATGDVAAPLTETVFRVSGEPVWTSPALAASLGIGCAVKFR